MTDCLISGSYQHTRERRFLRVLSSATTELAPGATRPRRMRSASYRGWVEGRLSEGRVSGGLVSGGRVSAGHEGGVDGAGGSIG
jgi:hypothetical protein